MPEALTEILVNYLRYENRSCEHCFSLYKNSIPGGSFHNLQFLNQILPMIAASEHYIAYYDYEEKGERLFQGWIIGSTWALGFTGELESGLVIWNREQVQYLKYQFDQKKKMKRCLLERFQDPTPWMSQLSQSRERYMKESDHSVLRGGNGKNYYIEPTPCLLFLIPEDMIESHLLVEEAFKAHLMKELRRRNASLLKESMVHIFTVEGLEKFAADGRLSGVPDFFYSPLDRSERRWILERYLEWMEAHEQEYYIIDERRLKLSSTTSVYSTVSQYDNEMMLCFSGMECFYCGIREPGIAGKLHQFCRMLEDEKDGGGYVYTKEESIKIIRRIIKKIK